jgi:uncharacterized SAM-binding protein YcdF (DUF218 family)
MKPSAAWSDGGGVDTGMTLLGHVPVEEGTMSDQRPGRGRRRALAGGAVLAVLSCIFAVATALLFVYPAVDQPRRSDAIVSLAGSPLRLKKALQLAHEGYAHQILLSVVPGQGEPCVTGTAGIHVTCFTPRPATTRGEARAAAAISAARGWHRLIVVADVSQVSRARMLFERCTSDQLVMVAVKNSSGDLLHVLAYEWAATVKALFERGC